MAKLLLPISTMNGSSRLGLARIKVEKNFDLMLSNAV